MADTQTQSPIPPCPFCDCNDDVISLRGQLREAQMAMMLVRPYVEDRLHRIDGEIDGSVAQLLSSLDAAMGTPSPQTNVEPPARLTPLEEKYVTLAREVAKGNIFNHPDPRDDNMRLVGFRVPVEVAGLSEALFALETIRALTALATEGKS